MARNTLSWHRCSFCGRRSATFTCTVNGRMEELCLYCIIALTGIAKVSCKRVIPVSLTSPTHRQVRGPDERLFRKFKIT